MKIHSDRIQYRDIFNAVPHGCYLVETYSKLSNAFALIHYVGSHKRDHAYIVRLSGSSPYTMAKLADKSATWDEWGIFIDALFKVDPDAIIGEYASRCDFLVKTRDEFHRIDENRPDLRKWYTAPWLTPEMRVKPVGASYMR